MLDQQPLSALCRLLETASRNERHAKEARANIEAELDKRLKAPAGVESTVTEVTEGYKIKVTRKLNRTLDHEAYLSLNLPQDQSFVTYKPQIDLKEMRFVERTNPEIIAACVTVKPAKTSFKLEKL